LKNRPGRSRRPIFRGSKKFISWKESKWRGSSRKIGKRRRNNGELRRGQFRKGLRNRCKRTSPRVQTSMLSLGWLPKMLRTTLRMLRRRSMDLLVICLLLEKRKPKINSH